MNNVATRLRHLAAGLALPAVLAGTAVISAAGASAQTTITLAAHYTNQQAQVLESYLAEYERLNPEIDVVYQLVSYRDYLQTVLTSRISGQSPDIYHLFGDWAPLLVRRGLLAEPPEDIAQMVRSAFVPSAVAAATIDDALWGVPTEISNYLLVYRRDLLRDVGVERPPATWDEFVRVAASATRRDQSGRPTQAGFAYGNTPASLTHPYLALLHSMGGRPFNDDLTRSELASPVAVEALERYRTLATSGVTEAGLNLDNIAGGNAAMGIAASWRRSDFAEVVQGDLADTIGVAPIPAGADWKTLQYAFFLAVDAGSDVDEEAWNLIRWLNTPRSEGSGAPGSPMGAVLADLGSLTGLRADIDAHPEVYEDPFTKPFIDALPRSVPTAQVPQAEEIEKVLYRAVEGAVWGGMPPGDALTAASEQINGILADSQ